MSVLRKPKESEDEVLSRRLVAAGAEMLAPTNPYEVMRFRTRYGVGVIYTNAKARRKENAEATLALTHLREQLGGFKTLAPVPVVARQKYAGSVKRIMERDGHCCFFCGKRLGDDVTVEHLVAIAHGGPNHISNLFLAHGKCNQAAGHLSAPEKIAMRDGLRSSALKALGQGEAS